MNKFLNFLLSRQVITVAVVIVVCLFLCTLSKFVVSKIFSIKNKNIDIKKHRTIVNLVSNLFRLFVLAIGLIIVLQTFGVDTASFVASLGVFSLVIGLALQDVLKDFISGAYLVFEGQYSIGDWVKIGDFKGEVLASNFRTTKLRAYTGEVKIISNRNISEIINYSMSKNTAIIDVAVAYESDLGKVREVLDNLCELFKKEKKVSSIECLGVQELENSGIVFRVIAMDSYINTITLSRMIKEEIVNAFNESNITIPYPQVVVHSAK